MATGLLLPILALCSASANAQEATQILDRVQVFNQSAVLEMEFDDPDRLVDFSLVINEPGANFSACKLTATKGLWCLDGKSVVNWPNSADPATSIEVLSCEDSALNLDTRKANTCTGLTVDAVGAIYLAGKNKGKTHSLIKVVEADSGGACPTGFVVLDQSPDYCASLLATGRPLLVDINPIDGDVAENFNPDCPSCVGSGKGTLGLEQRKTAVFFPDDGPAVEIASGKADWNLQGNEQLLGIALLQMPDGSGGFDSFVLATTTKARILAASTDGAPDALEVFDIAAERDPASIQCASDSAQYGIRTSSKSGVIYVTDHNYCQVLALQPVVDGPGGALVSLANAQEENPDLTLSDLTLSTEDTVGSFPPIAPTLAPGVAINLAECGTACTLVIGASGDASAVLSNVTLVGSETGLTLFQIQGIPDCRYIAGACVALLDNINSPADLKTQGIVLDPSGSDILQAQLLNVTPLLPAEITSLFPQGLPNLWIPRWYRGQEENGYVFDAFFGVTDATFEGVFDLELFVTELTGREELGCAVDLPDNTDVSILRNWDVAIKVSENFISIDNANIPDPAVHEAMLVNTGCGSSRTGGSRWSLLPINMEIPADTWDEDTGLTTGADDALFAKLLISLVDDLRDSVDQLACFAADGQAQAPLSLTTCALLDGQWLNTRDKLDKCIAATLEPKSSSRNQNCQAFVSQLANFEDEVSILSPGGEDPANRIGELAVRLRVIENLYFNLFFPSIPDEGFSGL
jgi:hypothetical protein